MGWYRLLPSIVCCSTTEHTWKFCLLICILVIQSFCAYKVKDIFIYILQYNKSCKDYDLKYPVSCCQPWHKFSEVVLGAFKSTPQGTCTLPWEMVPRVYQLFTLNVIVNLLAPLFHIWEVMGSDLCLEAGYHYWGCSGFQGKKMWDGISGKAMTISFHILTHSLCPDYWTSCHCIIWATGSVIIYAITKLIKKHQLFTSSPSLQVNTVVL
jgi:hypothetical protein